MTGKIIVTSLTTCFILFYTLFLSTNMPTSKHYYCSYISSDLVQNCRSSHPKGQFRTVWRSTGSSFFWVNPYVNERTGWTWKHWLHPFLPFPSFSFFSICSLPPIRTQVFARHPLISDVLWPSKRPRGTALQHLRKLSRILQIPIFMLFRKIHKQQQHLQHQRLLRKPYSCWWLQHL